MMSGAFRHFLDLSAVSAADIRTILDDARARKHRLKSGAGAAEKPLAGKVLAMIFEKPSTRTRVSFDVGMRQLGGETVMLTGAEMQLGRSETIADTAKVLSRYVDAIMIRTTEHARLIELAEHATVPVINGLTDDTHPCQIMADMLTFEEHRGPIAGRTFAWTGDGNNVFLPYQVNAALMAKAKPDALFMHCLPAHRGEEVTDEVIDGPQSVVFDEAENRLHAQKAVLAWCLGA